MASPLLRSRSALRAVPGPQFRQRSLCPNRPRNRTFFNFFRKSAKSAQAEPAPLLTEDNLFSPFSKSPFPAVRARGEAIQSLATCPACASCHGEAHTHTKSQPLAVKFECPDCGFPTHCTKEHWTADGEHAKYCSRLREVNEDEHDLRSGRKMREFQLPGALLSLPLRCVLTNLLTRTTGLRGSYIIRELGCLLVYTRISLYGYGAFKKACQQTSYLPAYYWFDSPSK
jgi:splicing suppressor protein 51